MRKTFLMTVSAMALIATPVFAADLYTPYIPPSDSPVYSPAPISVVGHLELGIGAINLSDDDFDETVGAFLGAGRANIPFAGGSWNVEIETGGGALFSLPDSLESYSTIGAAGHVWTRLNSAAIGAYGAVNFPTGLTVYTLGIEGEAYFGNFTLGANTDYNWIDSGGGDGEFWTVRGYADAYFNPDFRFGGALSYLDFTSGSGSIWSAALNTEYRFSGTPFSVWAEGSYSNLDFGGGDADIWAGLVGFRIFMDGSATLEDHDRQVPWDSGLLGNRLLLEGL